MQRLVFGVLLVISLAGCAGAKDPALKRYSARAIIPTPNPDSVKISEFRGRWLGRRTWVATTPQGVYDCSAEPGEEQAICVKREPKP